MYSVPEPTLPLSGEQCTNRDYTASWKATHIPINFYDSGKATSVFTDGTVDQRTNDPFISWYNAKAGT